MEIDVVEPFVFSVAAPAVASASVNASPGQSVIIVPAPGVPGRDGSSANTQALQSAVEWAARLTANRTLPARRTYWGNQSDTTNLAAADDTGQAVAFAGVPAPEIVGGLLVQPTGGVFQAWYREWSDAAPVNRVGARFVFGNDGGSLTTSNGAVCLAMPNGSVSDLAHIQINVHFTITPTDWTLGAFADDTLTMFTQGHFDTPLLQDGVTVYEAEIYRVGNTVTFLLPDGTIQIYTDPAGYVDGTRSGWSIGNYGFIEQFFNQPTDNWCGFSEFWADTGAQRPPTDHFLTSAQVADVPQVLRNKSLSGLSNTLSDIPVDQLIPTAANLLTVNPSFDGSMDGWTTTGSWAYDASTSASSVGGSARCTGTGVDSLLFTAAPLSVTPTQIVALNCQTKWASVTGSGPVQLSVLFYNSGTFVATGHLNGSQDSWWVATPSSGPLTPGGWVRLSGTIQIPAGVNQMYVVATVGAGIVGGSVWLDSFVGFTPTLDAAAIVVGGNGIIAYGANYQTLNAYLDALPVATQTYYNKTLVNPVINGFVAGVAALGTVGASASLAIDSATVLTGTLTANTECTFTMPAPKPAEFSFYLSQDPSVGNGSAIFPGVKWPGGTAPVITVAPGKTDILHFHSEGTYWYGSYSQNY